MIGMICDCISISVSTTEIGRERSYAVLRASVTTSLQDLQETNPLQAEYYLLHIETLVRSLTISEA